MNRHDPLKVFIEDGVLMMCIGVEVLAKAVNLNPDLAEIDEESGDWIEPEITDVDVFAREVARYVGAELSDDGTTLIHQALDSAAVEAIEQGAEGIKLPDDIIRERAAHKDSQREGGE